MEKRLKALCSSNPTSCLPLDTLLDRFVQEGVVSSPMFVEWLAYASKEWNGELKNANKYVRTFVLNSVAAATVDDATFGELNRLDVYRNIFAACGLHQGDPSSKVGLLKVLASMTAFPAGVRYLSSPESPCVWRDVVRYHRLHQTVYFSRLAGDFVKALVWQLDDHRMADGCRSVLAELVAPLLDDRWKNKTVMNDEENATMVEALAPTVDLLIDLMNDPARFGTDNTIIQTMESLKVDWHLWNLFQLCRKSKILGDVSKLLLLVRLTKVFCGKGDAAAVDPISRSNVIEFCLVHANLMSALISKRDPESVLNVSTFCFTYVSKVQQVLSKPMVVENHNGISYEFTNQILMMSILPTLCTRVHVRSSFVDLYIEKLISIACEHTTRMAYAFRDLVKESSDYNFIIKGIQHAVYLKKYVTKSQAIIIFQSFYYRLHDFVPEVEDVNNYVVIRMDTWDACVLTSLLLNAIYIYIDEFDIPWHDTVEVLCVYNFCIRVIKTTNLDSKLIIQAFKLAQLTIKKFLSPNLALLVDSAQGSVIEEIGKNIYEKLHDACWDIRDSAMELLIVVTDIAVFKFPAFQEQISDNNLPQLVVTLAMEDSESYVRASALKCIAIMVRIPMLWEKQLRFLELTDKMINILNDESEGLVRKEAAYVVVNIYEYQKFMAASLDNVFLTMHHAAAEDLHWEVQLAALQFWKKIIANQMSHQGMIDGIFPSVTFSKENRKIVHLNDIEVKKRLQKILNELALRGCLNVLLLCMKVDSDIDVMEEALDIIESLLQLLDKYNLNENTYVYDKSISRPILDGNFLNDSNELAKLADYRNKADVRNEQNNITCIKSGQDSDKVIDSIVNSDDMNLLSSVYANRLKVESNGSTLIDGSKDKNNTKNIANMLILPVEFIKTVKQSNFRKIIEDKKKWTTNLTCDINSLLDDILGTYTPSLDAVNAMDCY